MKTKILFLMLAIVFIFTTVAFAGPPGAVKNSPLFKASLKQIIEKMEGKITEDDHGSFPTIKGQMCIMMPWTQSSTCIPSACQEGETCGGYTCSGPTCSWASCSGTCTSTCQVTCESTCASTCASTCGNQSTCLASVCICDGPYVEGYAKREGGSTNWSDATNRLVMQLPDWGMEFGENGYYFHSSAYGTREMKATALRDKWYEGYKLKPYQGDYLVRVDIQTYRQP